MGCGCHRWAKDRSGWFEAQILAQGTDNDDAIVETEEMQWTMRPRKEEEEICVFLLVFILQKESLISMLTKKPNSSFIN